MERAVVVLAVVLELVVVGVVVGEIEPGRVPG